MSIVGTREGGGRGGAVATEAAAAAATAAAADYALLVLHDGLEGLQYHGHHHFTINSQIKTYYSLYNKIPRRKCH